MYPDGPLLTMSRTTPLSESGIRAGSRHPLRAAGLVSSPRITFSVAESKRRVRPRRYDTSARCTSLAEMCPFSAGAFRSSFLRLRTQSMKFAKVPSSRFGVPGYFGHTTIARCIRPCNGWKQKGWIEAKWGTSTNNRRARFYMLCAQDWFSPKPAFLPIPAARAQGDRRAQTRESGF